MKKVVIDASAILAFIIPDETAPQSINNTFTEFSQQKLNLIAPKLLKLEVSNALRSGVIKKRMTKLTAKKIFKTFLRLSIDYQKTDKLEKIFQLALKHELSVYDATYLQLALQTKSKLLTLDQDLNKAWLATQTRQ
jgi:predicted nucleic acid-binding protein